ncbi:putative addiction module killer protein [Ensifer adhaerens]|nr:putative addiction module killer protein [Ensifer adhaerens]
MFGATPSSRLKDERAKAMIVARLLRLAEGNPGDVAPVGDAISELPIHYGPGCQKGAVVILLLCGGDKSSQTKDIATAKAIAKQWSDEFE